MTTFKVIGVPNVFKAMDAHAKKMHKSVEKAITDEGNDVLRESMEECPVRTGRMRRTGTVDKPKISGGSISVIIGYHVKYAADVHENLEAQHKTGKAKFLEDPINRAAPGLPDRMAKRMRAGGLR
jgi:hypothetical protein